MIGSIKGQISLIDGDYIIVETGGVGYRVLVPSSISSKKEGEKVALFIHTHVKEEALDLYGFDDVKDLKLFQYLIGVNGVGPKTAITLFSFSNRDRIVKAVLNGDVAFFTRVPRLGKKNAQKIIIELKNKLGDDSSLDLSEPESTDDKEVIEALRAFGFSVKESRDALKNIEDKDVGTEEKIKFALKSLGK